MGSDWKLPAACLALLLVVAGAFFCWWYFVPTTVFHEATGRYTEEFDVAGVQRVILRSTVPSSEVAVQRTAARQVVVDGTVTFDIAGYHGSRADAGVLSVPPARMELDATRVDGTLTLTTREWLFGHHSCFYEGLAVKLPTDVSLDIRELHVRELMRLSDAANAQ